MNFAIPRTVESQREVWNYKQADWDLLRDCLDEVDWDFLRSVDPDDGAATLTAKIMR